MLFIYALSMEQLPYSRILTFPCEDSWIQTGIECPKFSNLSIELTGIDEDALEFKPLARSICINNNLLL